MSALVDLLCDSFERRSTVSVTWLNHYSAQVALDCSGSNLELFNIIGIDGKLLQRLLGAKHRTSADLVVPKLTPRLRGARVAIVGGTVEGLNDRVNAVRALLHDSAALVYAVDGFDGLPPLEDFAETLDSFEVDVLIVGLGAGLQEAYVSRATSADTDCRIALTCGGFLDQIAQPGYYPEWAYPLRLNWLVRLVREPRRMWRRYTIDALRSVFLTRRFRRLGSDIPSIWI